MTVVIRSDKSVATRARPKIDGLLSAIFSYLYSPPNRDRTGVNHDRLNIMMASPVDAFSDEFKRWRENRSSIVRRKGPCL